MSEDQDRFEAVRADGEWQPSEEELETFRQITELFPRPVEVHVNFNEPFGDYVCEARRREDKQVLCQGSGPTRLAALQKGLLAARTVRKWNE